MQKRFNTRKITITAILSAVAAVLMYLEFPVMLVPSFIELDFSELPALIAAFALGPVYGVLVCFIKNVVNLPFSSSLMVGELANFLIGISFVLPAGLIYKKYNTHKGAIIGSAIGAILMALFSIPINYYITYPIYAQLFGGMGVIISAYTAIYSKIDTLLEALVYCNMPFTFVKGFLDILITLVLYKRISPFLKGKNKFAH